MSNHIADVPISSIQEVDISRSEETDEVFIIDEDSNIVLSGDDEGYDISIALTLVEQPHPEHLVVDEQRNEVKSLASNDVADNYFQYDGTGYFLSVEDISIPEEAPIGNLYNGTIDAKALPYPKHLSDERAGNDKRISSNILYSLDLSGEGASISIFVEGDIEYSLDYDVIPNLNESIESEISYSILYSSSPDLLYSTIGDTSYSLQFDDVIADMKWSSVGCLQFTIDFIAEHNHIISILSNAEYSLQLEGALEENLEGPFGSTFGRQFGGT